MKYIITESQLEKIYKKYFDMEFKDSYYNDNIEYGDGIWRGVCIDNNGEEFMLIGQPVDDKTSFGEFWYYNGPYFETAPTLLDIGHVEFAEMMKEYLNDRFGLKIGKVM
jgi:hypothetical protein